MSSRHATAALLSILALYLLLGTVYSVVTPVFEAPDESYHFFVIAHIREHGALPVQRAENRGLWEQEASQPPLYYLLGALVTAGLDLSGAEDLLWRNPQANVGDPNNPGNKNVYIHPPDQGFPWGGTVRAIHVVRFVSVAMGAGTVYVSWRIARLLFPSAAVLSLAAAGAVAFIPQFVFVSSSVNNDNAMALLATVVLHCLLQLLRWRSGEGPPTVRSSWVQWSVLGVLLGLALLTKLSALALVPLAMLAVALVGWHSRSWRAVAVLSAAVLGPALLVSGWWYARNIVLYGEPTGLQAMWEAVGMREGFGRNLWGEFRALRYSFWGMFGWFSIAMPRWVYLALDVSSGLAACGLCVLAGRWLASGRGRRAWRAFVPREPGWGAAYRPLALGLLGLWAVAVVASLVRWTSITPGTQGRLLFPAVAPIMLLWVLGIRVWLGRRHRDVGSAAIVVGMFALAGTVPWTQIAPSYALPVAYEDLPAGAVTLEHAFGDAVLLRGVGYRQETVRPGDTFLVRPYWELTRPVGADDEFLVALHVADPLGAFVGVENAFPAAGVAPASLWPTGRVIEGRQYVRVADDLSAPLVALVRIGLHALDTGEALTSSSGESPLIGRTKIVPHRWPRADGRTAVARFAWTEGGDARRTGGLLLGPEWESQAASPGTVRLSFTWQVLSAPERDYTTFVHLADQAGNVLAFGDGAPRGGLYPTWAWADGEVIEDAYTVILGEGTPPGRYRLLVGLYDRGGRVPAFDPGGLRWPADAVDLGSVDVQ